MLRVITLDQLFQAAETLSRLRTNQAEQLTILTHGGGAGVMAADTVEWTARGLQWNCYRWGRQRNHGTNGPWWRRNADLPDNICPMVDCESR